MKTRETMMMLFLLFFSTSFYAQTEVEKWNNKTKETNEQVTAVDTTLQDARDTFDNLSKTIGGLFGNRNTVVMGFSGIEFGDEKLSQIVEHFRSIRGVKDVTKLLNRGTVTVQMKSKMGPSQIWENLPQALKGNFKVIEANENTMVMQYKKPAAVQTGSTAVSENRQEN